MDFPVRRLDEEGRCGIGNDQQDPVCLRFSLYQGANLLVLSGASYRGRPERRGAYRQASCQSQKPVASAFRELLSTLRQAVGVDRLSPLLPVNRRRVRHLNRRRQRWASPLQHIIQILARVSAAAEIERDLSARHVLDHDSGRMRRPTLFLTPMLVIQVIRQNPHPRVVNVKELSIRRQIDQMSVLFFISADSADPMPGKNEGQVRGANIFFFHEGSQQERE